ncbi:MAG: hypothetical protein AB7I59_18895 [Geminicoccaceae bacterium]
MRYREASGWLLGVCLITLSGAAHAIDLTTGDGYLLALEQPDARDAAENELAGTFETLVVLNEVLGEGTGVMFCLSGERAAVLDVPLLRKEFTDWLRTTPSLAEGVVTGGLPVSMLALTFMARKFPCDEAVSSSPSGDSDAEVRARLLESLPK